MVFSSITFLVFFLCFFFGLYYVLPARLKNGWILTASLVFYGWLDPPLLILLVFEITAGWWIAKRMVQSKRPKAWLISGIFLFAGLLGYFKYADFFLNTVNVLFKTHLPLLKIALPLGISFYTFQLISYLADVYTRQEKPQKSLIDFGAYIAMFSQLVAGPIVRYSQIAPYLKSRKETFENAASGWNRFVCGLSKKIILANALYACRLNLLELPASLLSVWMAAVFGLFYVYYDFSGYSDMAIGLSKMMGFQFPENFRYPFTAGSVSEFWRRWHISLTTWFKDYVYIPLGGSRKGLIITLRNLLVVWLLTGLWHGADWIFVLWGLYFFFWIALEKVLSSRIHLPAFISHTVTLLVVLAGFELFLSDSISQWTATMQQMSGLGSLPLADLASLYYAGSYFVLFIVSAAGSTAWIHKIYEKTAGLKYSWIVQGIGTLALLVICLSLLALGSQNPFLYFRF